MVKNPGDSPRQQEKNIIQFQKVCFQASWSFLIRYLVWKVLYSNELEGKSIFIISGTREEFANYVKKKMEDLFIPRFPNVVFDSKYTELWINKTWIKVMPTKKYQRRQRIYGRGLFVHRRSRPFRQVYSRRVRTCYYRLRREEQGKTIMVSTPNAPGIAYGNGHHNSCAFPSTVATITW